MIRITRSQLRKIIREAINTWKRNAYTSYDDPFGVDDMYEMDLDIQKFVNRDGTWSVKINCGWDKKLSEPLRVFKTQVDANDYARRKSDEIYRKFMNSGEV